MHPDHYEQQNEQATLFASGLIAGDALMGIGIAGLVVSGLDRSLALRTEGSGPLEYVLTMAPFAALAWGLARMARRAEAEDSRASGPSH